jgi:hypothetical protein
VTYLLLARKYWKLIGLGLLCLLLAVQTVRLGMAENEVERVKISLNEVRSERDSLIAAAKEAERLNKEQVKRIVTEQDRISDNVEADLIARLERLRSELRAKADNGNTQGTNPGSNGDTAEVPADPAKVCISSDQFLLGAEYEEKLQQWINWYERQLQVKR